MTNHPGNSVFYLASIITLTLVLNAAHAFAAEVSFPSTAPDHVQLTAQLVQPEGPGPFPAMVLLPGCGGVAASILRLPLEAWAARLRDWGYASLLVNSFNPRGVSEVCHDIGLVPPYIRLYDAFGALLYLQSLPQIRPQQIGVMGWSHGGWPTLKALGFTQSPDYPYLPLMGCSGKRTHRVKLPPIPELPHGGFKAGVAYYPCCRIGGAFAVPPLIFVGEKDDWTPAAYCRELQSEARGKGAAVRLTIYPEAQHGFDEFICCTDSRFCRHTIERNPAAANLSEQAVKAYLDQQLKRAGP